MSQSLVTFFKNLPEFIPIMRFYEGLYAIELLAPSLFWETWKSKAMVGALLSESMFAGHAAAAGSAVAVAAALTHPLDTLKTLLQVLPLPILFSCV